MYLADIKQRARELYPENPTMQQRWEAAIAHLRSGAVSRWVLDGQFKPGWNAQTK